MTENHVKKKALSTSSLAKELHTSTQSLLERLSKMGLVSRISNTWELTPTGKLRGGLNRDGKFGRYITWPETLKVDLQEVHGNVSVSLLTATSIGKHFGISANRANSILSELGWINKGIKGWLVTELGKREGGIQSKDQTSGTPYVRWSELIVGNKILVTSIREVKGEAPSMSKDNTQNASTDELEFREKFPAKYRATDGHYVRSKAEMLIDNWLYMSEVIHAYERKLPIEEVVYSDFYIPSGKVYIEYWGLEDNPRYSLRKNKKRDIYRKHGFKVIELTDKEVQNLDDKLPRLLLEHGIKTE